MISPINENFADADDEIFFEPGFSDTIPYSPISLGDNQVSRWTEDSVFFHNDSNSSRRKSSIPRYRYFTRDYPKPWLDYLYEKKGYYKFLYFCLSHSIVYDLSVLKLNQSMGNTL